MRTVAVVAGLCAVLAVAGCSKSQSGQPQAAATTTLSEAQLWDPCSLPDSAVAATGVDPSTKDTNPTEVAQPGWRSCRWRTTGYFMTVNSTSHTMDEVRNNSSLSNIKGVDVPGRQAVSYNDGSSDDCGVDFPTSKGLVEVIVRKAYGTAATEDSCVIAVRSATTLNQSIPQ
ncbi:DUF3558 domain-containing protein [Nocardia alni]|uniref:DUF3558 domain-containing protein n=1 Tax=Nocardia alni TaxID=2815723 RepID=UPI0034D58979